MYTFTRKFWKTQSIKMRNEVGGWGGVESVKCQTHTGEKKKNPERWGWGTSSGKIQVGAGAEELRKEASTK